MDYKYYHNSETQTVYRVPTQPNVTEERDSKTRKLIGWTISMSIVLTRADNTLINNHWKYSCGEHPEQFFPARYNLDSAISYFYDRHTPRGDEIDQVKYQALTAEYETKARNNHDSVI
jgi:hypothetical protein